MNDILLELFKKHPYEKNQILATSNGEKYFAIMLTNGNIGVCSNLDSIVINESTDEILVNPDFNSYPHRIVVTAWINACCNYSETVNGKLDISQAIDFTNYSSVVMVGYFGSLTEKLLEKSVNLTIFDLKEEEKPVTPMSKQIDAVKAADCLIITSTSITNKTYANLLENSTPECHIYLLGPSTPITSFLFSLPNIYGLFGSRFMPFDFEVLNTITQGGGTRSFLGRMEKVYKINSPTK